MPAPVIKIAVVGPLAVI